MEKAVVTVLGVDRVGIIADTSAVMKKCNINILDISQTIVQDMFTMMMIVDLTNGNRPFDNVKEELDKVALDLGVQIKIQHMDIFQSMHRI
ncbi:MAG: ACT domain-containing protein [Clostridia bacterium]|jgi:ACT domain-containing protein|nr:ACT domain-containing protein [Clostridiaceae bacterium]